MPSTSRDHERAATVDDAREKFLLAMYGEMWGNINRHILVVWQPLGVVAGGVALFALVGRNVIGFDAATSIFLVLVAWLLAHAIDAFHWYDRNIRIIGNIERQFLQPSDAHDIHYFFTAPPKRNTMEHVRLQFILGATLGVLAIIYHFYIRVWPGFSGHHKHFQISRAVPYVIAGVAAYLVWRFYREMQAKLDTFISRSPGRSLPTAEDQV